MRHGDLTSVMVLHCGVLHCQALSYLPQLPSIPLAQHEGLHGIHAVLVEYILHGGDPALTDGIEQELPVLRRLRASCTVVGKLQEAISFSMQHRRRK